MVAALHEHRRAAERERLLDLLVDHGLRQHVALAGVARPPVERAEVAVGDADVGVVDVAVDDERDLVRVALARTHLVGGATDGHEVARAQQAGGILVGEPGSVEHLLEDGLDGTAGDVDCHVNQRTRAVSAKRSSGAPRMAPHSAARA